jgi:hypothetical protein
MPSFGPWPTVAGASKAPEERIDDTVRRRE